MCEDPTGHRDSSGAPDPTAHRAVARTRDEEAAMDRMPGPRRILHALAERGGARGERGDAGQADGREARIGGP